MCKVVSKKLTIEGLGVQAEPTEAICSSRVCRGDFGDPRNILEIPSL
jgi:hypothetical protein